jgi:hypothetical protein
MATNIDIILRALGGSNVRSEIKGVGDTVAAAGNEASTADGKFKGLGTALAGLGITAAGAGMLALADNLTQAYIEADQLGSKMNTLLSGAGIKGASDEITKLAGQLAIVTGGDDDAIGAALAQAIATGRTRGLAEYGIVLSDAAKKSIEAATAISETAGKQETLNQVMLAGGQAVTAQKDNLSQASQKLNEYNLRMENLQETVGQSTAEAKAAIVGGILSPILAVIENSPGLQTAAGYFLTIGGGALSAVGSVVTFAGSMGQAVIGLQAMRTAREASAAAAVADTVATEAETIAVSELGVASEASAGKAALLRGGYFTLAVGAGIALGAVATKIWETTQGAEEQIGVVQRLKNAWAAVEGVINPAGRDAAANREQYDKLKQTVEVRAADMRSDGKSEAEIEAYKKRANAEIDRAYAATAKQLGDNANYVAASEELGRSRKEAEASRAMPDMSAFSVTPSAATAVAAGTKTTSPKPDAAVAEAQRNAGILAGADASIKAEMARARIDALNDKHRQEAEDAKDEHDAEIDRIQAAMKNKTIGKTAGQAQIDALRENWEKRQQALDLDHEALVKRIEAETILAEAATKAAAETGARKEATLSIANQKAASLRDDADRAAKRAKVQRAKSVDDEAITAGLGPVKDARAAFAEYMAKANAGRGGIGAFFGQGRAAYSGAATAQDAAAMAPQVTTNPNAIPAGQMPNGDRVFIVKSETRMIVPASPFERRLQR